MRGQFNLSAFLLFTLLSSALNAQIATNNFDLACYRPSQEKTNSPIGEHDPVHNTKSGRTKACASTDFVTLSNNDRIQFLKNADYECLRFLFTWEASYASIYSESFVNSVFTEIENLAPAYNGTKSSGLYGLMVFCHTLIFNEFYHPEIKLTDAIVLKYKSSLQALAANPNIFLLNNDALDILFEFLVVLDYDNHRENWLNIIMEASTRITVAKINALPTGVSKYKYNSTYNNIFYFMFRGMGSDVGYQNAVLANPSYVNAIYDITLQYELQTDPDSKYLLENAILEYGRLSQLLPIKDEVLQNLSASLNSYSRLSAAWLTAVQWLGEPGVCEPLSVCREDLTAEIEQLVFPNRIVFDNGRIVVWTDKTKEELNDLYAALKEVEAQFFRFSFGDAPTPGDTNENLIIKLYPSAASYQQFQNFLYGLSTNNGGIYIEQEGTFYTFDRAAGQSAYTFEALVRHEYVHYLQGRYLIAGSWGNTEYYGNNRLTWYEEGMAEFITGATRHAGIRPRRVLLDQIATDQDRMTTSEITHASYDVGQAIYRNSGLFFQYLYEHDLNAYLHLNRFIKEGLIQQFDSVIAILSSGSYNEAYQQFLNHQVSIKNQYTNPDTDYHDNDDWHCSTHQQIEKFATPHMSNANCSVIFSSSTNERFAALVSCDPLNSGLTVKERFDYVNGLLDDQLIQLENATPNNLAYCTAYPKGNFLDNGADFQFVVEGPLRNGSTFPDVLQLSLTGTLDAFQNVVVNDSVSTDILIDVNGNTAFAFDSIATSSPFVVKSEGQELTPGQDLIVSAAFKPANVQVFMDNINFFSDKQIVYQLPITGTALELEITAQFPEAITIDEAIVGESYSGIIPFQVGGNKPFRVQSLSGPEGMTFDFPASEFEPGTSGQIEYQLTSDEMQHIDGTIQINSNATSGIIEIPVHANFVVGILEESNQQPIFFPNPATTMIFLTPVNQPFTIEIKDLFGRIIATSGSEPTIDIADYPSGLYIVKRVSERGVKTQSLFKK